jgi:hypothetical protein
MLRSVESPPLWAGGAQLARYLIADVSQVGSVDLDAHRAPCGPEYERGRLAIVLEMDFDRP